MTDDSSSSAEAWDVFLAEIRRQHDNAHTANAILVGASLENLLELIIKCHMPKLSNTLAEVLFRGYGPFSSFSAKIDCAYAMGDIDQTLRSELHAIRDIRNKFAHPKGTQPVKFTDPELTKPFSKFHDFTADYEVQFGRQAFLVAKFTDLLARLQQSYQAALNVGIPPTQKASPRN